MARQIEYDYDSTTYNTTNTSATEIYSYDFTPKANTKYLVLVSYKFWGNSTYVSANTMVRQTSSTGTMLGFTSEPNYNTEERYCGGTIAGISYGASPPGTDYIKVFLYSQYSSQTSYLSDIRLIIMEVDSSTEIAGGTSCNTNTNTSYIDCLTLTFTPASSGDYLILGYMSSGMASSGDRSYGILDIDGTDYQESYSDHGAVGRHPHVFAKKITLSAASHTIKIQHKVSGSTGTWCYPKLVAIRLDNFYGNDIVENTTQSYMTGQTYYSIVSKTATKTSHPSIIIAKTSSGNDSTSYYGYWRLFDGSNAINETIIRGSTGGNLPANFVFLYDTAPSETYYTQVKNSDSGQNTYYDEAEIFILDLYSEVEMNASVAATSSVNASLDLQSSLTGTIASISSIESTLILSVSLSGIITVILETSLSLDLQQELAGTVLSISELSADLSLLELNGSIAATTNTSAVMNFVDMIEVWRSVNAGSFVVVAYIPFSDTPYLDSDINSGSVYCYKLIKYVNQIAVDWSNIDCTAYSANEIAIDVSLVGQSSVSGFLAIEIPITGTIDAQSVVYSSTIDIQSSLIGTISSNAYVVGILDIPFHGIIDALTSLTGILDVQQIFIGLLDALSTASSLLSVTREIATSVSVVTIISGDLEVEQGLASSVTCQSNIEGILDVQSALVGQVQVQSTIDGTLIVFISLDGGIDVFTSVEGIVNIDFGMIGIIDVVAAVIGQFQILFIDAEYTESNEYARITWWEAA